MSIQPKLRTLDLAMIIFSLVVGVGIFRTPTEVARHIGTVEWYYLAWLTGGVISLFGALTYAEIGARYSVPGGLYQIFSHAYHPAIALMVNWALLLTMGASFAGVALIGAQYIGPLILPASWNVAGADLYLAVTMIVILTLTNLMGIRAGSRTQNVLSGLKIILMLGICALAFFNSPTEDWRAMEGVVDWAGSDEGNLFRAFGISLISVFFTYGGYQQTMNFGADVQNPKRNFPLAIFWGVGLIIVLYMLINWAYVSSIGIEGIQQNPLVAAATAYVYFGPKGQSLVSITIFISVMGFLNATLLSTPRMYYAMAEDKVLPPIFKQINSRTQVQEFSLIFYVLISIISLFSLGTFKLIVDYVMSIDSLALAGAALAIYVLRYREKQGISPPYDGFRVPLYPILPAIFILFLVSVSINVLLTETVPALVGYGLLLLGYPMYLGIKRMYKK